jgi:hypothetical protein
MDFYKCLHIKSTAEAGYVFIKKKNIGGLKESIEIVLIDS